MTCWVWLVVNLDTGESKRVSACDNATACAVAGWDLDYCVAHIVRRAA